MARIAVQALARAGAVELLTDYADDVSLALQIYRGRPKSIHPPTAFVDAMRERLQDTTGYNRERIPVVEILVLHGTYDFGDTVDQRDAFVDGFLDWVADNPHAFGDNTLQAAVSVDDEPAYVPDWLPPDQQKTYYATRLTLEGFANT